MLLHGFGPWLLLGIGVVIFIESGVLFPFLPGDSLLITAALLREELALPLWQLLLVAIVAAFLGDQAGYYLGFRFGRSLFRPSARILKPDRLDQAEEFFSKHGPAALILGRFVPLVRTYLPLAAGTASMTYRRFLRFNVVGAVGWVLSIVLLGFLLGRVPGMHSIDLIMLVVVGFSIVPIAISAWFRRNDDANGDPRTMAGTADSSE